MDFTFKPLNFDCQIFDFLFVGLLLLLDILQELFFRLPDCILAFLVEFEEFVVLPIDQGLDVHFNSFVFLLYNGFLSPEIFANTFAL